MASVIAALKANDIISMMGEKVNDLALSLVAPLGAYDNYIGHGSLLQNVYESPGAFF
jgi:hypothetical protein